jgi:ATP-dependent RNA helicase DDX31/DBP7
MDGAPPKNAQRTADTNTNTHTHTHTGADTMADDGMLLNFSIPDSGILAKPSIKGGSWRDRLTAKKAAQNWHTKATARLNGETLPKKAVAEKGTDVNRTQLGPRTRRVSKSPEPTAHGDRPVKRARVSGDFRPRDSDRADKTDNANTADFRPQSNTAAPKQASERQEAPKKGNKQIISSLFTYNPTSTTKTQPAADRTAPVLAAHLLNKMGLKAPTAIQKAAITQLVKDDSDAFIQAETGSGKTLSYLLPIVQRLMELSANMKKRKDDNVQRNSGLFAIILAPTRELSKQIALVLEKLLGCAHWLVATTVIGGEKKKSEKARLRKGIRGSGCQQRQVARTRRR